MLAVIHALTGAVIGLAFNNLAAVAAISFFLHYVMDLVPHIDPETFASKKQPYTWKQSALLITDCALVVSLVVILYGRQHDWAPVLVGAIASLIPDFLIPLEKYRWFWPLRHFHYMFHWDRRLARQWHGYLAGLIMPTIFAAITGIILWWSF